MQCPSCNAQVRGRRKRCAACGAGLTQACDGCGKAAALTARFCSHCGQAILRTAGSTADAPAASTAERRQMTILFSDIVGSVALSNRLDTEDFRTVIAAYQHRCRAVVRRHGGYVAQFLGDGIVVYFGYPTADESDVDRALRAGLELTAEVGRIKDADDRPLSTRIGIATGEVVAGDIVFGGSVAMPDVVGTTSSLAARLQTLAEPGGVVVCATTRRLAGGLFRYRDLGRHELRGFAAPVPAWQVLHESGVESRFEARAEDATSTPLVGRRTELDLLRTCWQEACAGRGQVVLIGGEPGIGKSRLADALRETMAGEPHRHLRWFGSPHHADTVLHPHIAQISRAAGIEAGDDAAVRLRRLEALMGTMGSGLEETMPLLADLLGIPTGDAYPPPPASPARRRRGTFDILLGHLLGEAGEAPVLALCEDAHWLDPTSLDLLGQAAAAIRDRRVLLLVTHRPEFQAPPWAGERHVSTLSLARLRPEECAEIAINVTGKALHPEISREIIARSDGVPLFVEELTRAVLETDMVADAGEVFLPSVPVAGISVPATLQGSLAARLDRLGPAREVASIGAALGRSFPHALLAAVSDLPAAKLQAAVTRLLRADLIQRREGGGEPVYVFRHALIRDAAYHAMLREVRQALHGRIAATIEARFPAMAEAEPADMARHLSGSGDALRAVPYWRAAAERAASRSAYGEASEHLRAAVAQVARLPPGRDRDRTEIELLAPLCASLSAARGYSALEVESTFHRARELCDLLGTPQELYPLLYNLANYYAMRCDWTTARELLLQCLQAGEAAGSVGTVIESLHTIGFIEATEGDLAGGRRTLERAVAMYREHDGRALAYTAPQDPAVGCLSQLSSLALIMGDMAAHEVHLRESLALAEEIGGSVDQCWAHGFAAHCRSLLGDPEASARHAATVVATASEHGLGHWLGSATMQIAAARTALGRAEEAIPMFVSTLQSWAAIGADAYRSGFTAALAQAYLVTGRLAEARAAADEAIELSERVRDLSSGPLLYLVRGAVRSATGDLAGAEADFRHGLAQAQDMGATLFEAMIAPALQALLAAQAAAAAETRDPVGVGG